MMEVVRDLEERFVGWAESVRRQPGHAELILRHGIIDNMGVACDGMRAEIMKFTTTVQEMEEAMQRDIDAMEDARLSAPVPAPSTPDYPRATTDPYMLPAAAGGEPAGDSAGLPSAAAAPRYVPKPSDLRRYFERRARREAKARAKAAVLAKAKAKADAKVVAITGRRWPAEVMRAARRARG
jgi:hypothetical protein